MITETKSGTFVLVEEQKQSFKLSAYLYIWVPGLSNLYLNAEQTSNRIFKIMMKPSMYSFSYS